MDRFPGEAGQARLRGWLVEGSVGGTNRNVTDPSSAGVTVAVDAAAAAADDVIADQVQPILARESNLDR